MNAPISWCLKKQNVVAFSSCEVKYIAAAEAACQCLWLETLLEELKLKFHKPMQLCVDNKYAISLFKNSASHGNNKHIETKFHFLRDQVCNTEEQVVNVFTKSLRQLRFEKLRNLLGLKFADI